MTPLQALLETVLQQMREALELDTNEIMLRTDETVAATAGTLFVGVYSGGSSRGGDVLMGLDQRYSVNLAVTQRTGAIPDDRIARDAALHPRYGCQTVMHKLYRAMEIRKYLIVYLSNQALGDENDGCFVEPLTISSPTTVIRNVGPPHFQACPPRSQMELQARDFGLLGVMNFNGARYMENVIEEVVDLAAAPVFTP